MKVYIVTSGCVFDGGTNRHVALTEARAVDLAEALVDKFKDDVPDEYDIRDYWKRNDACPKVLACEVGGGRRVALWQSHAWTAFDFVAVHEWEVEA